MELIADILLVAGALGAGLYCFVLSRRLKRFTDLEKGVGGAVAVLSSQADELKKSLDSARSSSDRSGDALKELTQRAETVAQRLELMMASMHDVIPHEDTESTTAAEAEASDDQPEDTVEPEVEEEDKEPAAPELENKTAPDTPTKAPEGLMFFRHHRKQSEAAK
ncbi:hypothetical protein HW561_10070 [Rhodobacteraceae bacterium B1Z28]|uniref:DUF948 domain-containing protein n=1 Tax=Ruegeria haliotis TaxID=2747601 RepID=A0ABX2PQ14_9RHOB|nr:hypothetical protein [Ruegeria haliotis]NVO56133.1 hypothetical protein [Ruegeria haliotis]